MSTMTDRLRVLFIAFYYPPTSGGGVERTIQFSRRLPQLGIDVEMLVPTDAKWLAEDPASVSRIPADITVHRVKYRGPSLRQLPGDRIRQAPTTARKLAVRASLAPQRLFLPDANAPWLADVVPAALKLLKTGRFDAFITTTPPHTVAVAGRLIRARTDVPWIADGVRDREDRRHEVQALFRDTLARFGAPVTVVQGTWEQRLATATALIDSFTDPYHHG